MPMANLQNEFKSLSRKIRVCPTRILNIYLLRLLYLRIQTVFRLNSQHKVIRCAGLVYHELR